jgi:hypothetical protein
MLRAPFDKKPQVAPAGAVVGGMKGVKYSEVNRMPDAFVTFEVEGRAPIVCTYAARDVAEFEVLFPEVAK